jgi:oxygen-dependent protoporphyrinogen oxidase
MSTEQVLPRHRAFEKEHGSVTRGLLRMRGGAAAGLVSLQGGLGSLVSRLATALDRVEIRTATPALRLDRDTVRGCWTLQVARQPSIEADQVILACPAHAAARLLVFDAELASLLGQLDYAGCATVYLLYPRHARQDELRGSGFFVPRTAGHPLLACSYVNRKFPDRAPRGTILLRAFLGGVRHPEIVELPDERLIELTRPFVERVLTLGGEPLHARCFRHPRAMPQFEVAHAERLAAIARRLEQHQGLGLCGAASGATGLPDCIESGERAAEAALARAAVEFALTVSN